MSGGTRILIIDDEPSICWAFKSLVEGMGQEAHSAGTIKRGLAAFDPERDAAVILDVRLPDGSGIDALAELRARAPRVPVIVITAHGGLETAVDAMQAGAFDYLVKPVALDRARAVIARALTASTTPAPSSGDDARPPPGPTMIGRSAVIQEVFKTIGMVAASDSPILIQGENGTGKELTARAIHAASAVRDGPFEPIDCAALPAELVESELFGHVQGAFTGAHRDRAGRVSLADGGTLFLDEIGELPLVAQPKLLRFLAEREVTPVGGGRRKAVKVRLIAATNRLLEEAVAAGDFREDLFYRLNVIVLRLPPLRARREDIPLLVQHFLRGRSPAVAMSEAAMAALKAHAWRGNVRELRNVVERAAVMARGALIQAEELALGGAEPRGGGRSILDELRSLAPALLDHVLKESPEAPHAAALRALDLALIDEAMGRSEGSRSAAARLLKLNRATLRKRLDERDAGAV